MNPPASKPVSVFLSYAHKDESLLEKLNVFLSSLKRCDLIETWHDRAILPGQDWSDEIDQNLEAAEVILLLISQDFINSDYCYGIEMKRALERRNAGEAEVIPISLRPADWTGMAFSELQALPKGAKPITRWDDQDEALLDVAKGIRKVVETVSNKKQTLPSQASAPATLHPTEPTVGLWVHGWEKQSYEHSPSQTIAELSWQYYFDRDARQVPKLDVWQNTLQPELKQIKAKLLADHNTKYLDIRGKLPLSYSLALGATFPRVGGFQLRMQQDFQNEASQLWHSHAAPSELKFKTVAEDGVKGNDLLIAFGISGSLESAVKNWQMSDSVPFTAEIYLEPETGAGRSSLKSEGDAVALAAQAGEAIFNLQEKYDATHTHIILRVPAGFALFLGQQLNAIGTVTAYEWTRDRVYQPAVQLRS